VAPAEAFNTNSKKRRDPRFDSMSGKFNEDLFEKTYSFLDEKRDNELSQLKKNIDKMQKRKSRLRDNEAEHLDELKQQYSNMKQAKKTKEHSEKLKELKRKRKREEKEKIESGEKQNPEYPS